MAVEVKKGGLVLGAKRVAHPLKFSTRSRFNSKGSKVTVVGFDHPLVDFMRRWCRFD